MRDTKIISRTDVLYFPCEESPFECSYSQEYFASNSEHVTLETMPDGHTWARNGATAFGTLLHPIAPLRDVTPDDLHPWERDLVTNGAPFARPSTVRS